MTTNLINQVKARFSKEPDTEKVLWSHWNKVCDKIQHHAINNMKPKLKVYEVHHMTEVARKAMLTAFVECKADSDLETIALNAIGLEG